MLIPTEGEGGRNISKSVELFISTMSLESGDGSSGCRSCIVLNPEDVCQTKTKMPETCDGLSKSVQNVKNKESGSSGKAKIDFDFDTVIGHIEDMLIDDEFHNLQLRFLEKYWEEFVDSEENKHEYMNIFMEYTNEIEEFIKSYVKKLIPHFEMEDLIVELEKRKDSLDGEVFEVLFTLTDFSVFKEMFLDYRLMKEGSIIDLGKSLYVSPIQ